MIGPATSHTEYIGQGFVSIYNSGKGFTTGWINIDGLSDVVWESSSNLAQRGYVNEYTQLRFVYRTDYTHDRSNCLDGGNIGYRVKYKFDG